VSRSTLATTGGAQCSGAATESEFFSPNGPEAGPAALPIPCRSATQARKHYFHTTV
jgi:hypothetical protein